MKTSAPFHLYLGVLLTSSSAILCELSLTKIFSVVLWYHFAYFVVSLSLFGLGAGGLAAFWSRAALLARFPGCLKHLAFAQGAFTILCLGVVLGVPTFKFQIVGWTLTLAGMFLLCAVPFVLTGMIISIVMQSRPEDTPRVYFADLLGAGMTCPLFVVLISQVSGPAAVLIGAHLAFAASVCFALPGQSRAIGMRIAVIVVLAVGLYQAVTNTALFRVRYTKTYAERKDVLYEKWSPLARITVYPTVWWAEDPQNPFGWGMGANFKPEKPIQQMWIEQDASAGTPITRFSGDLTEHEYLKHDVTAFAYHLRPDAKDVFIIGCGGGRDVLTARVMGVPAITACDIHPVTVGLVKGRYKDFAGNLYGLPGIHVDVAEGRSFLRRQSRPFDIVQISLIDSWAATVAGAFTLAENNLYTQEAFREYLDHLNDDGMLSVTRYLFTPRNQCLRTAILGRRALEMLGTSRPEESIAVLGTSRLQGMVTILVKKKPFDAEEIGRIEAKAKELGFEVLYAPGIGGDPDFVKALTAHPLDEYLRQVYYDLRPSTDNRPFFFQMMYFSRALDLVLDHDAVSGQRWNYLATLVLLCLLVVSTGLVAIFFFLPLALSRRVKRLPATWGVYFILLGLGFMFVEIYLLQKGSLYLEHPTLSLVAVLFSMLTAAGLGSLWTRRLGPEALTGALTSYLRIATVLIFLLALGTAWMTNATMSFPLWIKLALFISVVATVAFFLGTLFPTGIRLVSQRHESCIPWVWALNGGASVTGSILAMTIAMAFGYIQTLLLGCACYLVALLIVFRLPTSKSADPR